MITCRRFAGLNGRDHPTMQKISAYILTYNEAEKIEAAVASVLWADEVVVVDSFSTDRTAELATALGARVVRGAVRGLRRPAQPRAGSLPPRLDFQPGRRRALHRRRCATRSWRCSRATPPHDVYRVPRQSYMMGRWIRGSGWYPNFRQPQLFRKGAMRYTLEPVHEGYENLSGKPLGTLQNAIWQFPFRNLEEVIRKMNRYSSLGVPKLAGKRVSMASALGHGLWSFIKHYVFKRGFIDGWAGFVIAFGNFEGTFYRYAKRYEETQGWQPPESKPLRREAADEAIHDR